MSRKKTPRNILFIHDDKSERVARLVMQSLPKTRFPLSRRNIRWGFSPEHYFLVFLIGQESRLKKFGNAGNCQFHPYEGYARFLRERKSQLKCPPLRKYQERSAGEITKIISQIFERLS